jgi:type IV secretory pathway TrbL component
VFQQLSNTERLVAIAAATVATTAAATATAAAVATTTAATAATATVAAATATATAAATAATSAGSPLTGFIDRQWTTVDLVAVQGRDRGLQALVGLHLDKTKTTRTSGLTIGDHFSSPHGTVWGKHRLKIG